MGYSVVRDFVVDDRDMRLQSSGVGTPLLLLHELAGSARSFLPVVGNLVAAGREVVALDLPGHGHSAAVPGSDLDGNAWAVAGALDEVTAAPMDVVGVDYGGFLALTVAALFPGRIRSVIAVEPLAPPAAGRAPGSIVPLSQRARGALTVVRQGRHGLGRMHSVVEQLRTADPAWWSGLENIDCPVLVVDGGGGQAANLVDLDALSSRIPRSRRLSLATGNRPWVSDPPLFADVVTGFLREVDSA